MYDEGEKDAVFRTSVKRGGAMNEYTSSLKWMTKDPFGQAAYAFKDVGPADDVRMGDTMGGMSQTMGGATAGMGGGAGGFSGMGAGAGGATFADTSKQPSGGFGATGISGGFAGKENRNQINNDLKVQPKP